MPVASPVRSLMPNARDTPSFTCAKPNSSKATAPNRFIMTIVEANILPPYERQPGMAGCLFRSGRIPKGPSAAAIGGPPVGDQWPSLREDCGAETLARR